MEHKRKISDNLNVAYELIGKCKEEFPKLYNFLCDKQPINVLDLGCMVPATLFNIYHVVDCNLLKGVDSKNEEYCVQKFIKKYKLEEFKEKTFFKIYKETIQPYDYEKIKISSELEFNQTFSFEKKKIDLFLRKDTNQYDLIIASNVLHFFIPSKVESVLLKIKAHLKKDSLVLIRVQEGKEFFNYEEFKKAFKKIFSTITIYEYYDEDNKWNHSLIFNQKSLL